MESLPLTFASGWASGVNCYLVVLVLGIADQVGDFDDIPDVLGRWDVLTIAGILYAMEFVADKIPYVDSTWDAVSTLIRPTAGAVIGALLAGNVTTDQSLDRSCSPRSAAVTALLLPPGQGRRPAGRQHVARAGHQHRHQPPRGRRRCSAWSRSRSSIPRLAAAVAGLLLVIGLVLLYFIARLVRRGWRRWKAWRAAPAGAGP